MGKKEEKLEELRRLLKRRGPISTQEILKELSITQPTFSRMASNFSDLLAIGDGRSRLYGLSRTQESYPLIKIGERAEVFALGELRLLEPRGAAFIPQKKSSLKAEVYSDVPFFIWDVRPQGYLGKIFVSQHPELKLPDRWEDWQESDLYRTLKVRGDDLVGNLVIGHESFEQFQSSEPTPLKKIQREVEYPKLADAALQGAHAGSSAGGEQPKFTTAIQNEKDISHVIVKFSPPTDTDLGRRWANLLFAENVALKLLLENGYEAARSEVFECNSRVFLEVTRFDRVGRKGRKGMLSLGVVDDEYVGERSSWTKTAIRLLDLKLIKKQDAEAIVFLDCFGTCIANTDRHFGNLSMFWEFGKSKFSLAPVYDMLPMAYAPVQGNIVEREYKSPVVQFEQLHVWESAKKLGIEFWHKLSNDDRVSNNFKEISRTNLNILKST